jgi:hypothetical protein
MSSIACRGTAAMIFSIDSASSRNSAGDQPSNFSE